MKFTKKWTEFIRPLGSSIWRPTLDVGVAVTMGWETHRFLVDSGADLSMAPYGLFRLLGKRWKDGQPRVLRAIPVNECSLGDYRDGVDIYGMS